MAILRLRDWCKHKTLRSNLTLLARRYLNNLQLDDPVTGLRTERLWTAVVSVQA